MQLPLLVSKFVPARMLPMAYLFFHFTLSTSAGGPICKAGELRAPVVGDTDPGLRNHKASPKFESKPEYDSR
jgi:hypothetical protein